MGQAATASPAQPPGSQALAPIGTAGDAPASHARPASDAAPPDPALATGLPADYRLATVAFQRGLIESALRASGGSLGGAARRLALTRHALRHQMLKLGLKEEDE